MEFFKAIEKRRAVKHYDPEHQMTADQERKLFDSVLLSPTAFNIQNWRFVVVRDGELRKKIKEASWGQEQITDASLLIVLCADLKAWEKGPERYWSHAPENIQDFVLPAIDNYYRGKEDVQRDEAMRSCGIAAQSIMLSATAMGYDSCPMDGFDFEAVAKLINLPEDHIISMFVVVGKGIKEAWERGGKLSKKEVVRENLF